jgi:hypothetical protein
MSWSFHRVLVGIGLLSCAGCLDEAEPLELSATPSALTEATDEDGWEPPPFPPETPVEPSPLTDQSLSLAAVLEHGSLSRSDCDRYFGGQTDRETELRCGKWMYFYSHIEVPGLPAGFVDLLRSDAPGTFGRSLEKLGLFRDPYSADGLPVGLVSGPAMALGVPTYTMTCGACHLSKVADGRFVVGSPNQDFEFGKLTLLTSGLPEVTFGKTFSPEVERVLRPVADELFRNPFNRLRVMGELLRLLPNVLLTQPTAPDDAAKQALALLPPGVMDPFAAPGLEDGVAAPVRISPLWGIDPDAMEKAGSSHGAMLTAAGGTPDLMHIMLTSAAITAQIRKVDVSSEHTPQKMAPLIAYILSLRPPASEKPLDAGLVQEGHRLFYEQQCVGCHNGPGFAGTEVFDPRDLGTDANIADLLDPGHTGRALHDVVAPDELTRGIRARRLSGVWSLSRLLHNGSLDSLAELFCLDGPRKDNVRGSGHGTAGHAVTCDLARDDKLALIAFLESL